VRKAFGPCIMIIYPGRFKIKTKVLTRDDQGQLCADGAPGTVEPIQMLWG
jgi:hypothetical protein